MSNGTDGRAQNRRTPQEEKRVRNEYHPDSTTPVGHLDTTIDRSSKINLFAAVFVVVTVTVAVGSAMWTARGFIDAINRNTQSVDEMTVMMEEALDKIEENARFSAQNRGRIEGLESEVERMNRRIIESND